jgi:hypothetical protein
VKVAVLLDARFLQNANADGRKENIQWVNLNARREEQL